MPSIDSDSFPYRGISTLAIGIVGTAMVSPLLLVISLSEFIMNISPWSFVVGLGVAITIDYMFGRLTDNSRRWPKLPAWTNSPRVFVVGFVISMIGVIMPFFPAPSWAPTVAIGGINAFATASATVIIFGSTRSATWLVRQMN